MKRNLIFIVLIVALLVSCAKDSSEIASRTMDGQAGSLAKMITVGNKLYVINQSELKIFDVSDPLNAVYENTVEVGFGIETIFPFGGHLFIGSVDGMYIYDISDPTNPFLTTAEQVQHITACDPVVANENYAYVTLNTLRSTCGGLVPANQLMTYDVSNITDVELLSTIELDGPKGLGLDGDKLFVCDKDNGVLIFDLASDPTEPMQIDSISGFTANDVIASNGQMMVVCEDGLRQFDYTDINNIQLLSLLSTDE